MMQLQLYNAVYIIRSSSLLTGRFPATGRCTPETCDCWLEGRLMMDSSIRPTMQAGVSRTAGGCKGCKDEWKQESYGPRLRNSCWSLVCVSPWPLRLWYNYESRLVGLLCVSSNLPECWHCNQCAAKLLSKDAIDRLWSFVCCYLHYYILLYYILYSV